MMCANFFVRPSAQEQVEATAVVRHDSRPALLGTVVDEDGKPVRDALAVLYTSGGTQPDRVADTAYSDELGRFCFGPLEPGVLYLVQISKSDMRTRTLELNPD